MDDKANLRQAKLDLSLETRTRRRRSLQARYHAPGTPGFPAVSRASRGDAGVIV